MIGLLGSSIGVFIGVTVVLFGGAAILTGQGLAAAWRPVWQILPYGLLLAAGARFLTFALFEGELLSISGYVLQVLVLIGLEAVAYRATLAHKMVAQYPWLYERAGPFHWRPLADKQ